MNKLLISFSAFLFICFSAADIFSNNVRLSNFTLQGTDVDAAVLIRIDSISWENSWRCDIPGAGYQVPYNFDAIWFFAKYKLPGSQLWKPAKFNPSPGFHNFQGNISPAQDSMGLFLYRNSNGSGSVIFNQNQFCFHSPDISAIPKGQTIEFRVFAIEMVYIPGGSFYVGDGTTSNINGQLCGSNNSDPFQITSEAAITLGGLTSGSMNNHNSLTMINPDDFNDTVSKVLPAAFPKGFNGMYCMKYEVTSQQYADFLNSLNSQQQAERFAGQYGINRNSIKYSAGKYVSTAPERANNFMSWGDCAAYADWTGLRPMSELEYEKIARGTLYPLAEEYAWGSKEILLITSFSGTDSSGTETALPVYANCNYNLIDGANGQPIGGPVRTGIFATSLSDRVVSGASYYGVMEMSGNLWERPVAIGNTAGRAFTGLHGNGILDDEGNADVMFWPSSMTGEGSGFRGGNWFRGILRLRVSDRFYAGSGLSDRTSHRGFRGVRTVN